MRFKDQDYRVEIANDSMLELWGTTKDVVINKPLFNQLPELKGQGFEQLLEQVYKTGESFSAHEAIVEVSRKGKQQTLYFNFSYDPFRDNKGNITGIIAVAIDVTKEVEARHKIEEAEERARLAIESSNIGTYDIDLVTNNIITSKRFDELFQLQQGATRQDVVERYHPEDRHIRDAAYEEALENGNASFQVRILLKDGSVRWIKFHGNVLYDKKSTPVRLIGTALDVTPLVQIQRHKDDFITIASHELKTPLTSIKAYNQLLFLLVKDGDQITSLNIIKKSERQIQKMTDLIHNFLDLSRLESDQLNLDKENFDINDLISETINYYYLPENKERLRFKKSEAPIIHVDRKKLSHVIDNILNNALKYSDPEDPVLITSGIDKQSVIISIQDRGKGINEFSKNKIFERFYRADNTAGSTSGFGIGLYLSSEIIRLHGGRIWFDSTEDQGSTFYCSLPISDK